MERRQLVKLWRDGIGVGGAESRSGSGMVLATLVRVEGSSYRRPGARLLTGAAGRYAGTISGGCLEAEVVRKAEWLTRSGAVVERYATTFDDTAEIPFGLGCGGTVELLLERVETPEGEALMMALEGSLGGREARVATWLPDAGLSARAERPMRRVVWSDDGDVVYASAGLGEDEIRTAAGLAEGVFLERLEAPQRLFVLGAGDDAKPLVNMAAMLGWSVTVVDGRAPLAREDRFPAAEQVVCGLSLADVPGRPMRERDAAVIMTHSYEQDRSWLREALPVSPRYLGLLGARHRSSLLVREVAASLGWELKACCERIYAPVGLDLGGDGPEAIALAVLAEAQACAMGKVGTASKVETSRRLTPEMVETLAGDEGGAEYRTAVCALEGAAGTAMA